MAIIHIPIYFDTVCPWCFIGHRSLQRAIDLYRRTYPGGKDDAVNVKHVPYYLNRVAAEHGVRMDEAIVRKNGQERQDAIQTRLKRTGKEYGIHFDFSGKTGRTRMSHQLVYRAGQVGGWEVQERLVQALYQLHFEQGGDVTSVDDRLTAAVAVGIAEADAREWMADQAVGDEVDRLAAKASEEGISAVPTMYFNGVRVEGAEDVGAMYEALVQARGKADGGETDVGAG